MFFKKLQLPYSDFEDTTYFLVKLFFNDKRLILTLSSIITYLLRKEEKLQKINNIGHFILSDFIFAFINHDLQDPANLVFKISRTDYLYYVSIRSRINVLFEIDPDAYQMFHKKFLVGLRVEKILTKYQIRSFKNKIWNTVIYFQLKLFQDDVLPYLFTLYTKPFYFVFINKYCFCVGSFRKVQIALRKNREMESVDVDFTGIIRSCQIPLTLSLNLYKLYEPFIKVYELNLLQETNCETIDFYFKLVKKTVDAADYHKFEKKNELTDWVEDVSTDYKILENFQNITTLFLLKSNLFDKKFYLPGFIDNRERQYYSSLLSPTFYTLIRYLITLSDVVTVFKNLNKSEYYKKILRYKYLINDFNLNDFNAYVFLVLLIEVGKHFIKNKNSYFISTVEIITLGLHSYTEKIAIKDFDENLYLLKIYQLIDNLLLNGFCDFNTLIFKDATASGLQNYGVLLGYRPDKLHYLNIDIKDDNEGWYDTYQYIINKYISDENQTTHKDLQKRKYWKNTIMTVPYNATLFSCFNKFKIMLKEDGIDLKTYDEEKRLSVREMHRTFYYNMKREVKLEFYENITANLKQYNYNDWIVEDKDEYKVNYKTHRDKYVKFKYTLVKNDKKTQTAIEANNMHFLDSQLVKTLISIIDIIPIHDCFGVRLCELHLLMDNGNRYYSKHVGRDTYSIHLFL